MVERHITEDAAHVFARNMGAIIYEDLPSHVVDVTKNVILDTLGVTLAGSGLGQGSRSVVDMITRDGGKEESSIIGYGSRVPASAATLANGALAHAIDYDDVYSSIMMHLDAITVPAALAVAEKLGGVSGKDLITAVALGNEVATRLGLALFRGPQGFAGTWHPSLVFGYFSSTAAAAKLLKLTREKILDAFGIALCRTAGTMPFLSGPRTLVAELYYGFPAQAGVMSALMAQNGITGPSNSLEGKGGLFPVYFSGQYDRAPLVDGWGEDFHFIGVDTKPWPAARVSHCYIQAALDMVMRQDIRPEDVAEIVLVCGPVAQNACQPLPLRRRPGTSIDAKFSIPFIVSVAVARRSVGISDFLPEALDNPVVLGLADKVTLRPDPKLESGELGKGSGCPPAVVEISTVSGKRYSQRVDHARGAPEDPMSRSDLVLKFRDCASFSAKPISDANLDQAIEMLTNLENVREMSPIVRLVCY